MKTRILILMTMFSIAKVYAQEFTPYKVWTSENYNNTDVSSPTSSLPIDYTKAKFVLSGNFDNDPLTKEIALLINTGTKTQIYVVYSTETQDLLLPNNACNLALDRGYANCSTYDYNYSQHKTVLKAEWSSITDFNLNNVSYAVAGDFDGDSFDEIAMFYDYKDPGINNRIFVTNFNHNDKNDVKKNWGINVLQEFPVNSFNVNFQDIVSVVAGKFKAANTTNNHTEIAIVNKMDANGNSPITYLNFDDNNPNNIATGSNPMNRLHITNNLAFNSFNSTNVVRYIVGDYDGNGIDEIAMFSDFNDPTKNNTISVSYVNINGGTATYNGFDKKLELIPGYLKMPDIKKAVAGDFDGDGADELAMFYDYGNDNTGTGSLQIVFVTRRDKNNSNAMWWYDPVIYENNNTLNFDNILFATANNFDGDIHSRDDIALIYKDITTDNKQDRNDNKLLMYISKPLFADNDFMVEANDNTGTLKPFFPLGWYGVPKSKLASLSSNGYNTVVANRADYTTLSHCSSYYDDGLARPYYFDPACNDHTISNNISNNQFDGFTTFLPDYLATAQTNGIKVITDYRLDSKLNISSDASLNTLPSNCTPNNTNYITTNTNSYFNKIQSIQQPSLSNYSNSILGWKIADEPGIQTGIDNSQIIQKCDLKTHYDFVKKPANNFVSPLAFISCATEFEAEFYKDAYDVAMFDYYPKTQNTNNFKVPIYYWSRRIMESTIKYNKKAAFYIGQASGDLANAGELGFDYTDNSSYETRFSSFSPIIEGIRGLLFYTYEHSHIPELATCLNVDQSTCPQTDPMADKIDKIAKEVSTYSGVLKQKPLNNRISCNKDRYVGNNFKDFNNYDFHNDGSRYCKLINYTMHMDGDGNYYLFAINNYPHPVTDVTFSLFNDMTYPSYQQGGNINKTIPENYYLVNSDLNGYYDCSNNGNGISNGIAALDASNEYRTINTNFNSFEVKIFVFIRNKSIPPAGISLFDNPAINPIIGPSNICKNSQVTLSSTTPDGIWGTSDDNIANTWGNNNGGIYCHGKNAGNTLIFYSVGDSSKSCNLLITVNPLPVVAAITGSNSVCVGSTINLSNTTSGGVWSSSNTGAATVTPGGVVTGVVAGTATISYTVTNAASCSTVVTKNVTVNVLPTVSQITGPDAVCTGSTINLSNTTSGGVWSSGNTNVATVASGGVVTGVTAGSATISYTVTNEAGCSTTATYNVTVNPIPAVDQITGNTEVCKGGAKIYLFNNTNGGVWTSSNTNVASIGSTSGMVVSGNSGGTVTIYYTVTNSYNCSAKASIPILVLDNTQIFGPNSVCVGSSITLTGIPVGGTWSVVGGRATVGNPAVGIVTGTTAGNTSIVYTGTNTCSSTINPFTVNALPAMPSIAYASGTINPQTTCPSGAVGTCYCRNRTFNLVGTPSGGAWSSTYAIYITSTGQVTTGGCPMTVVCPANFPTEGFSSVTYTYTDGNGCKNSRTISGTVVQCNPRGIAQNVVDSKLQYKLFPNPAHSTVNVLVTSLLGSGKLVVTDLYGKQWKQQPLSMGLNTIDVSNLSGGIYMVSIITEQGKWIEKIVVE